MMVKSRTACPTLFLCISLLGQLIPETSGFQTTPKSYTKVTSPARTTALNLFEDDDVSNFNALCQYGPQPFIIRVTQPDKYWAAVENFEREEGTTRVLAVRNMDAFFADPTWWGIRRQREKDFGEIQDFTKKTGVQKRPRFSVFMLIFTSWFFFLYMPDRISEVGGVKPSALTGGLCPPDVRVIDANGKERFECKPKAGDLFRAPK